MPKNKNTSGLFACVNSKEPELEITEPTPTEYDKSRKELDRLVLNSKLSEQERKIFEEIMEKSIENQSNQTPQEKYLFSIMKFIKEFPKKKSLDEIGSLKIMIAAYIKLNGSNEVPKLTIVQDQAQSVVKIPLPGEQFSTNVIPNQNSVKPTLLEQTPLVFGVNEELLLKLAQRRAWEGKPNSIKTEQTEKNNKKSNDQKTELTKKITSNQNKNLSLSNIENKELFDKLAKRKELSERNTENNEKNEEESVNLIAVEGPLEQKNTVNIAASEQTQNSQNNSSLLEKLSISLKNLKKGEATEQTNSLPIWAEIDFLLERLAFSANNEKEDKDLELRLEKKISQHLGLSDEEFIKQAPSIKNSYFYNKINPILRILKRYLTLEKFEELNNEISAKNSEKQLDKKIFQKLALWAKSFDGCLSIIVKKDTNRDKSSKEFDKIEMQNQETMRQLDIFKAACSNESNDKKVKFFGSKTSKDSKDCGVVSATPKL